MDVAFYHDDPSSRIASAYDPQSSPGSVDSISSTDGGPVCAIAAVPPAFREQRFGQEYTKSHVLKGMNLEVESGATTYSTNQQQVGFLSNPNVVSTQTCHQSSNYGQSVISSSVGSTSANNLSLNISDSGAISNNSTITTPDLVNMLKVGSPDFDQMLMQYSQAGPQMTPQVYSRTLAQEQEMYAQNYARELARQKNHNGGSNPDIAGSNPSEATQHTAITTGASALPHPHQYMSPDTYYRGEHNEGPSSSVFSAPGTTVHHMGASLAHRQVGHSVMSPHSSLLGQMKEELPQTVPVIPNTRAMSPIDMEHQEVIKTERKRMRNRLAASKCRKRKLERISRLEEKVNGLKNQNLELSTNANLLRQQVAELKSKVMTHVNSGCQLMMSQQQVTF